MEKISAAAQKKSSRTCRIGKACSAYGESHHFSQPHATPALPTAPARLPRRPGVACVQGQRRAAGNRAAAGRCGAGTLPGGVVSPGGAAQLFRCRRTSRACDRPVRQPGRCGALVRCGPTGSAAVSGPAGPLCSGRWFCEAAGGHGAAGRSFQASVSLTTRRTPFARSTSIRSPSTILAIGP